MSGKDAGTVELDDEIFAVQPNVPVMHQVVTAQLAARRSGTQSTKTRAEVRGGGRKPYAQKGTGNARQGSIRGPHFSGGGVALGPKPRKYDQKTPKKMVKLALKSALSDRANEGKIIVVDSWGIDSPKTKTAKLALDALGIDGTALVVVGRDDAAAAMSFRNLPKVQLIGPGELNAYDVLCNEYIVFTKDLVPASIVADKADRTRSLQPRSPPPEARRREAGHRRSHRRAVGTVRQGQPRRHRGQQRAEGFPDQGQRRLDAVPRPGQRALQPDRRRSVVRHRGSGRSCRFLQAGQRPGRRRTAPYGEGSRAANEDGSEPKGFPIKGNADSMLFHGPDSPYYSQTVAEVWFATEEAAEAAGFSKPASVAAAEERRRRSSCRRRSHQGRRLIMKDPRDIILAPIVSEKSYALIEQGVYTFKVLPSASKPEIRDAVESIWGVEVLKVNTLNRNGKRKRTSKTELNEVDGDKGRTTYCSRRHARSGCSCCSRGCCWCFQACSKPAWRPSSAATSATPRHLAS